MASVQLYKYILVLSLSAAGQEMTTANSLAGIVGHRTSCLTEQTAGLIREKFSEGCGSCFVELGVWLVVAVASSSCSSLVPRLSEKVGGGREK